MIIVYLYLYTIGRTIRGRLCSFNCSKQFLDKTHHCKVQMCKCLLISPRNGVFCSAHVLNLGHHDWAFRVFRKWWVKMGVSKPKPRWPFAWLMHLICICACEGVARTWAMSCCVLALGGAIDIDSCAPFPVSWSYCPAMSEVTRYL